MTELQFPENGLTFAVLKTINKIIWPYNLQIQILTQK